MCSRAFACLTNGVYNAALALLILSVVCILPGCGSGSGSLSSIEVTPVSASIPVGGSQQFKATGVYSDKSTRDLTSSAIWASSSPIVAPISAAGLATGAEPGVATIVASVGPTDGAVNLTVAITSSLQTITVFSVNSTIAPMASEQFMATGSYSDGSIKDLTSTATWSSSDTSVATITSGGLASGVAAGSTTINAAVGSVSGTTKLSVSP
jgi:hypothetical protein